MDVELKNITKKYGNFVAVNKLSFQVRTGEILGFLGPNGAGKSTTMKMITGYLKPDKGEILLNGKPISSQDQNVKANIGYLAESNPLYQDMNVIDYLNFCISLYGFSKNKNERQISEMIKRCGLKSQQHKQISELSKGFKQRVGLAQALVHDPKVLILDEPTTGLDPNQIIEIRELIKEIGKEKTILLSSHILKEVEATCDRVIIINNGSLVSDDGASDKSQIDNKTHYYLRLSETNIDSVYEALRSLNYQQQIDIINIERGIIDFSCLKTDPFQKDLFKICEQRGWYILELGTQKMDLEDKFRMLTKN